jgi:hypothetical protein
MSVLETKVEIASLGRDDTTVEHQAVNQKNCNHDKASDGHR